MNAKSKVIAFADKVQNSKLYKKAEKVSVAVGAGLTTLGVMGMSAFAADPSGISTLAISEVNSADIINNALPFINAGIPILVVVGGIRLGIRFLRGSMR